MTDQSDYLLSLFDTTDEWWKYLQSEYTRKISHIIKPDLSKHIYLFDYHCITYNNFLNNQYIERFYEIIFRYIELNIELNGITISIFTPIDFRYEQLDNQIRTLAQLTYQMYVPVQNIYQQTCIDITEPIVTITPFLKLNPIKTESKGKRLLFLTQIKIDPENAIHLKLAKDIFLKLQQKLFANIYYSTHSLQALLAKYTLYNESIAIQIFDDVINIKNENRTFLFLIEIDENQYPIFHELMQSYLKYQPLGETMPYHIANCTVIELKSKNKTLLFEHSKVTEIKEEILETNTRKINRDFKKYSTSLPVRELKISRNKTLKFIKKIKGKYPNQFNNYFPLLLQTDKIQQTIFDIECIRIQNNNLLLKSEIALFSDKTNYWEKIQIGILNSISGLIVTGYPIKNLQIIHPPSIKINEGKNYEQLVHIINEYFPETEVIISKNYTDNNNLETHIIQIIASHLTNEDASIISNVFKSKGDLIIQVGNTNPSISSYFTYPRYCHTSFQIDFNNELSNIKRFETLLRQKIVRSAAAINSFGLYYTLLKCAAGSGLGFDITTHSEIRTDVFLFSDLPTRFLITIAPDKEEKLFEFLNNLQLTYTVLGHVTKEELRVDDISFGFVSDYVSLLK